MGGGRGREMGEGREEAEMWHVQTDCAALCSLSVLHHSRYQASRFSSFCAAVPWGHLKRI